MTKERKVTTAQSSSREKRTSNTRSFAEMFMEWHDQLARVGVEQDISFGQIKPDVLLSQIKTKQPNTDLIDFGISQPLWNSKEMVNIRGKLATVYEAADAVYASPDIQYQNREKVFKGNRDGRGNRIYEDDTYNAHGARASYFALKYLGVTDPIIHALLRFHDIKNFFEGDKATKALENSLTGLIDDGVLPKGAIDLILDLDKSDKRTIAAAQKVQKDRGIPKEFHQGSEHTPASLWKLYELTTTRYSSHTPETDDSYLTPSALFGAKKETNADEYRKHVARLALAYEKFTHPKIDTPTTQTQEEALMVLMELWPIARGLDEGILSRYAGDCIARAFMPEAFENLGKVVASTFSPEKLENQREEHSQWFLSNIENNLNPQTTFLTPMQMLQREYAKLLNRTIDHGAFDVAVPGVVTKRAGESFTNPHLIDVKTRSSIFWKMLERWNDPQRMKALPTEVQKLTFGSVAFWEWALSCHHDIFRSQLIFFGDSFTQTDVQEFLKILQGQVLSESNDAKIMYPDKRNSELYQVKIDKGIWSNLIYRPRGGIGNLEIQIKNDVAYDQTVHGVGMLDHIGYKLRHVIKFLKLNEQQINSIVRGGHEMRKRHLEMTYMFLDENNEQVQQGTVYDRSSRKPPTKRRK